MTEFCQVLKVLYWEVTKTDKTVEVTLQVTTEKDGIGVVPLNLAFWIDDLRTKPWDGDEFSLWLGGGDCLSTVGRWVGHLNFRSKSDFAAFVEAVFEAAKLSLWGGACGDIFERESVWRVRTRLLMNYIINAKPEQVFIEKHTINCGTMGFVFLNLADHAEAVGALIMYARKTGKIGRLPDGKLCSRAEFRQKVEALNETQATIAKRLNMSERGLRMTLADESAATKTNHNYCHQYAVESLKPWLRFDTKSELEEWWP